MTRAGWSSCVGLGLAVLVLIGVSAEAGSTFVKVDGTAHLRQLTKAHYTAYIEAPQTPPNQFKIVFTWFGLAGSEYYQIEADWWSFVWGPVANDCSFGQVVSSWSGAGYIAAIPDYPEHGRVGARQLGQETDAVFNVHESGIDGIGDLTDIGSRALFDVSGSIIDVTVARLGRITDPAPNWGLRLPGGCTAIVPPGTYWVWHLTTEMRGQMYQHQFIVPEDQGQYLDPDFPLIFLTEFLSWPGVWRASYWDVWGEDESVGKVPFNGFLVFYRDNGGNPNPREEWGVKLGSFQDHPVMEISSDGVSRYLQSGEGLSLAAPVIVPPPPCSWLFFWLCP